MHVDACKEGNTQNVLMSNSILYFSIKSAQEKQGEVWRLWSAGCHQA